MKLAPGQIEIVLGKLQGVRNTGENQWQALCPCHDDRDPSLSVGIGDERKLLLYCFTGCPYEEIVAFVAVPNTNGSSATGDQGPPKCHSGRKARIQRPPADRGAELQRYTAALTTDLAHELADHLGLPVAVLENLDIGWCAARKAWSFPECDATGRIIGIAFRGRDGHKVVGKGHKRGLTVPKSLATLPDPVLLVEGPSDVLACLSMGLTAVGRPSAMGGVDHIAEFLGDRQVLVVGENDQKTDGSCPGRSGAKHVAQRLADKWGHQVAWTMPPEPAKDIRDWHSRQDENPDDPGPRLLDALRASAQVVKGNLQPAPPPPPRPNPPPNIPPPPTGPMTLEQAKARERDTFQAWDGRRQSTMAACVALFDLREYGGLDVLGRPGKPLPYSYFAGPWDVRPQRIAQLMDAGRIWRALSTIVETDPLIVDGLRESHVRPLTKCHDLAKQLEALRAACQIAREDYAAEQAHRRAHGKRETRLRLKARHVKRAVAGILSPEPAATTATAADAANLWKAQEKVWKLARITPDLPGDVSAAIEEAVLKSKAWAKSLSP